MDNFPIFAARNLKHTALETPDPDPLIGLLTVVSNNFYKGFTDQPISAIIGLAVLVLLLIASALISSSETAFFSLQPADIDDLESRTDMKSKLVLQLRAPILWPPDVKSQLIGKDLDAGKD